MTNFTATYSVEDNAIRLTADGRVGTETYERLKAARFQWQRGSNTFKAAAWSPEQEDLAIELAGEIEDEDSTLEERAEARADRYEGLSEARSRDASSAYQASKSISDFIPMGQPILVGHHSEGRHRSDLRKIDNRMRAACENWKKAEHWEARATAALRHAKHKNDPSVRARRIKGLEADQRKVKKNIVESQETIDAWNILSSMKDREQAKDLACRLGGGWFKFPLSEYPRPEGSPAFLMSEDSIQMCTALERGLVDFEKAHELVVGLHQGYAERARRWADHYEMRLVYERAMLKASGGTMADRTKPEKGGAVQCWVSPRGGWSLIAKVNKVSVTVMQKANYGGKFYAVNMPLDKLSAVMTAAEVSAARESGTLREATEDQHSFFIVSAGPEALAGQAAE